MRGTRVLATARASLVAIGFASIVGSAWCPNVAFSATKRTSDTPFAYNTSGIVGIQADPASVNGPSVLQFQGVGGAMYDPAGGKPISLGQFVLNPSTPTNGQATVYSGTPFEVEIQAPELDKTSSFPILGKLFPGLGKSLSLKTLNENSVLLKGTLNGTVTPGGQANVVATVNTVKLGSFDAASNDHITHYTFPIHFSQLKLPVNWVMAGSTVPTSSILSMASPPTIGTAALPIAQPQLISGLSVPTASGQVLAAPLAVSSPAITPTPTPEPSTIILFATAFGGLILARRRRSAR